MSKCEAIIATFVAAVLLMASPSGGAWAADFAIVASVAMRPALDGLKTDFEQALGQDPVVTYGTAPSTRQIIESGAAFDVVITTPANIEALVRSGFLLAEPRAVVGVAVASIAYREGTPPPNVGNDAAFAAFVRSISMLSLSDPAKGGASSTFFMSALRRLGLSNDAPKLLFTAPGDGAVPVGAGTVAYGVALTSEIAAIAGVRGVPLLPDDPSGKTVLIAAISARTTRSEMAHAFIDALLKPHGEVVRRAAGLGP